MALLPVASMSGASGLRSLPHEAMKANAAIPAIKPEREECTGGLHVEHHGNEPGVGAPEAEKLVSLLAFVHGTTAT